MADDVLKKLDLGVLDRYNEGQVAFPTNKKGADDEEEELEEEHKNNPPRLDEQGNPITAGAVEDEEEEEEDDNPIDEEEEEEDEGDDTPSDDSPFKVWGSVLREKGLIDFKDEEFEDSEDFLISKQEEAINSRVESYKDTLPDEVKQLINNYEKGVPLDRLIRNESALIEYSSITPEAIEENEDLQRGLVMTRLVQNGMAEDKAIAKVRRFEDTGILLEEASDALEALIEFETDQKSRLVKDAEARREADVKAYENWTKTFKDDLDKRQEIIAGVPLTPEQRKVVYEGITKVDKNGKNALARMKDEDPEYDLKVAYLALVHKLDLGKLKSTATTAAARSIKATVKTEKKPSKLSGIDIGVMKSVLKRK